MSNLSTSFHNYCYRKLNKKEVREESFLEITSCILFVFTLIILFSVMFA